MLQSNLRQHSSQVRFFGVSSLLLHQILNKTKRALVNLPEQKLITLMVILFVLFLGSPDKMEWRYIVIGVVLAIVAILIIVVVAVVYVIQKKKVSIKNNHLYICILQINTLEFKIIQLIIQMSLR